MNKECNRHNRTRTLTWRREGKADKPWRKKRKNFHSKPIELCLCRSCANAFYLMDDHYIKRVDRNQKYKDSCCMCGVRYGFDYKIFDFRRPTKTVY